MSCQLAEQNISICSDIDLLNILSIFKSIIEIATIVIPVILTIFVMIDIIKSISSHDVDTKKLTKAISKRGIAAVVIFLIPFMIEMVIGIIPDNNAYYLQCYDDAEKSIIEEIAVENANALDAYFNCVINTATKGNKDDYNEAYKAYEQLRVAVKKIPNSYKYKDTYENNLEKHKQKLDALK